MTPIDLHAIPRAALKRAAVERPWVRRIAERTYRVVGRSSRHGKYIVTFYRNDQGGKFADCDCLHHFFTKEPCKHICAALLNHLRNAARNKRNRKRARKCQQ